MYINWRNTDLIIGHISEALAQHLRQRGKRLHFEGWNRWGQPIHTMRHYA
ncbi:hypothetical protein [Aquitalea sp. ASV11]|nr:hypothetical protein [Aquitalea sp. ASV11]